MPNELWSEFVRSAGEGWRVYWSPWRLIIALLDRITGAAKRIARLEERLASAEDQWSDLAQTHDAMRAELASTKSERDDYRREALVLACTVASCESTQWCDGCKEDAARLRAKLTGDIRAPFRMIGCPASVDPSGFSVLSDEDMIVDCEACGSSSAWRDGPSPRLCGSCASCVAGSPTANSRDELPF